MARGRERASSDGTRFNWQKPGWPDVTVDRAALRDELKAFAAAFRAMKGMLGPAQDPELTAETLAGPVTRYALNGAFSHEPIEGLNEGISGSVLKLVRTHPGVRVPYLHSVVSASRATVERAVAALVADGLIEHRGSKKTGGYFPVKKGKDK